MWGRGTQPTKDDTRVNGPTLYALGTAPQCVFMSPSRAECVRTGTRTAALFSSLFTLSPSHVRASKSRVSNRDLLSAVWMASPSAGSAQGADAPFFAVDTTELDRLCEKALAAAKLGRRALAAVLYGRAAEKALCLHGRRSCIPTLHCSALAS